MILSHHFFFQSSVAKAKAKVILDNLKLGKKEKRKLDSHQNKQIRISCQLRKKKKLFFDIKIEIRKQFSSIKNEIVRNN